MKLPTRLLLWRGPSEIDGEPIIVIATGWARKSSNQKTGDVIQTWILREDSSPIDCVVSGEDYSICGECKHRKIGTCYVNLAHGPNQIWKAYKRGNYTESVNYGDLLSLFKNKVLRLGAYGDPAAVPIEFWQGLCNMAKSHVGYTHCWQACDQELSNYCMASVDFADEQEKANKLGWRTFRILLDENSISSPLEILCPASKGKTTCEKCNLCNGNFGSSKNVAVRLHGAPFKVARFLWAVNQRNKKKKYLCTPKPNKTKIFYAKAKKYCNK